MLTEVLFASATADSNSPKVVSRASFFIVYSFSIKLVMNGSILYNHNAELVFNSQHKTCAMYARYFNRRVVF